MFTSFAVSSTQSNAIISVAFGPPRTAFLPTTPAPLVSTGSLQMQFVVTSARGTVHLSTADTHGFSRGEVRTLVEAFEPTSIASAGYVFGLYGMGNSLALISNTGNAYLLGVEVRNQVQRLIWIGKSASGVTGNTTQFVCTGFTQWSANAQMSLAFRWRTSGATIDLTAYQGSASNFSDLSAILSYSDVSGAYTSGQVAEGLWGDAQNSTDLHVFWDKTRWAQVG